MTKYLIAHIGHTTKDSEHVCWWKPESKGYTICLDKAGEYSEEEARGICKVGLCIAVQSETAAEVARSTPYYRRTDGSLAKLYDGDQHRMICKCGSTCWPVALVDARTRTSQRRLARKRGRSTCRPTRYRKQTSHFSVSPNPENIAQLIDCSMCIKITT